MDIYTYKLQVVVSKRYIKVIASKALYYIGRKVINWFQQIKKSIFEMEIANVRQSSRSRITVHTY